MATLPATTSVGSAAADVSVTYVQPEHFTDASRNGDRPLDASNPALPLWTNEIRRLDARYLPADARLRVEIQDVDPAGRFEPWRVEGRDVRILRDIYPPRIKLRHALDRPGQPTRSAEETVTDGKCLSRPEARFRNGDPLAIEKGMLADWFHARFGGQ